MKNIIIKETRVYDDTGEIKYAFLKSPMDISGTDSYFVIPLPATDDEDEIKKILNTYIEKSFVFNPDSLLLPEYKEGEYEVSPSRYEGGYSLKREWIYVDKKETASWKNNLVINL